MDNTFRDFNQVKTSELFVTRHKWFAPYYELTDGQFVYGKLSYRGGFRRHAVIETSGETWTVKQKGWFKRSLLINRGEEETIGVLVPETWKRNIHLEMNNGFNAVFQYKKLLTTTFTLSHFLYGDILNIHPKAFGFKKPFKVTYDGTSRIDNLPAIPLLILAGVNLVLIRQAQAHAAGAH